MAKQVDSNNIGGLLEALITKIKSAFWRKGETTELGIDNAPTSGSNNLAKSGGIFSAIAAKYTKPSTGIPAADLADGVIPDVSQFITKSVNDLTNYYLKSEVYTKEEVAALIGAIQQFHYEIAASTSAVTEPSNNVLYLIGPTGTGSDKYEEYVYSNGWVKIGDTSIDLSGYVTTEALNTTLAGYVTSGALQTALAGKQDKIDSSHKLDYSLLENTPTIPAAQVPADWDATTGVARILNKPTIPAAPVNADWNADSGLAQILNKPTIPTQYAGSPTAGGFANKAVAIPFGSVDADSTATDIKATVDNFPETLTDGVCAFIRNNVEASASGWTLNINGTGAKPVYASNADATRTSTIFTAAVTYLFIYNSTRVEGGCWDMYYGYNANDNTIGYNLRTNAMSLPVTSACYRYRLLFTSADHTHFVPANASSSTNATAKRTTTSTPIDPFGSIRYYGYTTAVTSGGRPGAAYLWEQYSVTLGYSFNRTGAALTLTAWKPVYIKCTPQEDGSAIIDAETPYVQELPTTADGKIYIYLGVATSATQVEVVFHHPVYYYDDNAIQLWTKPEPYNIRNNKMAMRIQSNGVCARYRLLFAGHAGTEFVAANESHSTSPDDTKTVTAFKIDPFGGIWYYSGTEEVSWGNRPAATSLWRQHIITLGYSFNRTGSALSLSIQKQVYIKCTPQNDGTAIIDADTPYVQNLPTTADGKIYILLGYAVSATEVELILNHPVYCYKDGGIRPWIAEKNAPNTAFSFSTDGSNATLQGSASAFSFGYLELLAPEKLSLQCFVTTEQSMQITTYYAELSFTNLAYPQGTETNINKAVYHFDDGFTTLEYHYDTNKFVLNGIDFIYNETTQNYETDQWPTS